MTDKDTQRGNVYSASDTLDINELASLNDDISTEFIEQLQNQVSQNASEFTGKPVQLGEDDSTLFEEVRESTESEIKQTPVPRINLDESIDDNFIKKYKAKLNKQATFDKEEKENNDVEKTSVITPIEEEAIVEKPPVTSDSKSIADEKIQKQSKINTSNNTNIGELTSGSITEKPIDMNQVNYNDSLDFLDDNIKYSKYVVYIDPENTEFIESLTVKERKNLINRILREQDDIAITKRRMNLVQAVVKHSIVAIVTIALAIPIVYWTINASLEASINNYRRSQTIFKTLYREKGKIKTNSVH